MCKREECGIIDVDPIKTQMTLAGFEVSDKDQSFVLVIVKKKASIYTASDFFFILFMHLPFSIS